jgi:hypothetical protein
MTQIPQELAAIRDYLAINPVSISRQFADGRVNSTINEKEIIKSISDHFDIERPPPRFWYAFGIRRGHEILPVDLKVTKTDGADNIQCKLGIYYALTGQWPDFAGETPWRFYFRRLRNYLNRSQDKDYYCLIVNKKNTRDVFCNSLKGLTSLVANGNNLPFQCKWDDNRKPVKRTHDEAMRFILGKFRESIELRASILTEFEDEFGNIV